MDKAKAADLEKQLVRSKLNDFIVLEFIDHGKSAAVFKCQKDDTLYAIKIFDNELVERFGHEMQLKRISQEIGLKDHKLSNLVKIVDGGNATVNGSQYLFIVMEYVNGMNLSKFIQSRPYNDDFIVKVIQVLFSVSEALLSQHNTAHRDIKPENIMVNEEGEIVLMNLGVLKLIGTASFTDHEEKEFVGTFSTTCRILTRTEEDTAEGWRAVNLYQIGAVAHDLIKERSYLKTEFHILTSSFRLKMTTPASPTPPLVLTLHS